MNSLMDNILLIALFGLAVGALFAIVERKTTTRGILFTTMGIGLMILCVQFLILMVLEKLGC